MYLLGKCPCRDFKFKQNASTCGDSFHLEFQKKCKNKKISLSIQMREKKKLKWLPSKSLTLFGLKVSESPISFFQSKVSLTKI